MHYESFSKKELSDILDLIHRCVQCRTEDDIIGVVWGLKDMACADNGICAIGEVNSGKLVNIINLNYPQEWTRIYMVGEFYKNDPIVGYIYRSFETHFWADALRVFSDRQHVDLMNKASDFGLKYGLTSGINGPSYKGSIFSFSSDRNRFDNHHLKILDIMTPHIHQALLRICRDSQTPPAYVLSKREKEVMNWMKEGKTNWEVSVILNISERTVKFHVQNIEKKLNAVNKAHAIAIAMDNGLVV